MLSNTYTVVKLLYIPYFTSVFNSAILMFCIKLREHKIVSTEVL